MPRPKSGRYLVLVEKAEGGREQGTIAGSVSAGLVYDFVMVDCERV